MTAADAIDIDTREIDQFETPGELKPRTIINVYVHPETEGEDGWGDAEIVRDVYGETNADACQEAAERSQVSVGPDGPVPLRQYEVARDGRMRRLA